MMLQYVIILHYVLILPYYNYINVILVQEYNIILFRKVMRLR